jgi:hypothetical protein
VVSRGLESQQLSISFLNHLSKFDEKICVICDQKIDNTPLKIFTLNQSIDDTSAKIAIAFTKITNASAKIAIAFTEITNASTLVNKDKGQVNYTKLTCPKNS